MTALIIISAIVLVILLLTNIPVYAHIKYYGGKADIKVKYAFIKLYPKKDKKRKAKKKRRGKPPDKEEAAAEDNAEAEPQELTEQDTGAAPDGDMTEDGTAETDSYEAADAADTADFDDEFILSGVFDEEEPIKDKPEKPADKRKKAKADKKADKKDGKSPEEKPAGDGEEKPSLSDKINKKIDELNDKKNALQLLLELIGKPLKKLCGKIRIDDIIIDFAPADEDAAKAAVSYGRVGAAVYNGISFIRSFISISVRSVKISCLYNTPSEKSRYDGECKIKLRPASLLNALFAVVFGYLFGMKKYSPIMTLIKK